MWHVSLDFVHNKQIKFVLHFIFAIDYVNELMLFRMLNLVLNELRIFAWAVNFICPYIILSTKDCRRCNSKERSTTCTVLRLQIKPSSLDIYLKCPGLCTKISFLTKRRLNCIFWYWMIWFTLIKTSQLLWFDHIYYQLSIIK